MKRTYENPYEAAVALMLGASLDQMTRQRTGMVEFELSASSEIFDEADRVWNSHDAVVPIRDYVSAVRDIFSCLKTCTRRAVGF